MIMLDTHVAVRFYEGEMRGLSPRTRRDLDRSDASISPIVIFELEMLYEIGRIRPSAAVIVRSLTDELGVRVAADSFASIVSEAVSLAFTRDPFDRLIVGHSELLKTPLITFDDVIHKHYRRAAH
jgi:PIN domain nuclease of toxin-antitoxin system